MPALLVEPAVESVNSHVDEGEGSRRRCEVSIIGATPTVVEPCIRVVFCSCPFGWDAYSVSRSPNRVAVVEKIAGLVDTLVD